MFYSKYSNYSPEDIKNDDYEKLCKHFLSIAKDDNVKEKILSILNEGGYDNFSVNTGLTKNNPMIERRKRAGYAYLLATHPETFETLTQNGVNLFHGTNANALPNILKYGMQSVDEQANNGIETSTGEEWSRINGKRRFISFTDDLDTALDYTNISFSKDKPSKKSFGVLIGMSSNNLNKMSMCNVHSDLPEIGISNTVPLEYIKTISVPEDKVEFVRKLVGNSEIIVTPISIDERFYYIDFGISGINIDTKKAKKLAKENKKVTTKFGTKEMAEMSKTRKISGIRSIYEKIKNVIKNKGKENEKNARD